MDRVAYAWSVHNRVNGWDGGNALELIVFSKPVCDGLFVRKVSLIVVAIFVVSVDSVLAEAVVFASIIVDSIFSIFDAIFGISLYARYYYL